jgi:3-keto-disaccharide hydrolase
MKKPIVMLALAVLTLAPFARGADNEEGFSPLFNGKDLTGWKLRNPNGHKSWSVLPGGVLKNTVEKGVHGTDLVTEKKFWNFTVRYEYMTPEGSNSGFYLRGRHELQILGDYSPDGKPSLGGNGAIYNFKAPDKFVTKPAGEWQTVEATMIGDRITVIMNGVKIHDNVVCDRPTGSEIDGKVKEPGPIFLQGDHGTVSFRNIRIKELPQE